VKFCVTCPTVRTQQLRWLISVSEDTERQCTLMCKVVHFFPFLSPTSLNTIHTIVCLSLFYQLLHQPFVSFYFDFHPILHQIHEHCVAHLWCLHLRLVFCERTHDCVTQRGREVHTIQQQLYCSSAAALSCSQLVFPPSLLPLSSLSLSPLM
jgi:hypothetical protein